MEAVGRLQQQALALGIGRGQLVEQLPVQFGIGADAAVLRQPRIARPLPRARRRDPRRHLGRAFRRRRQREVGGPHRRHVDVQIDAVEERPRDARLILLRAARRLAASERGIVEMSAAARVHRRHQLDARGIRHMRVDARDAGAAALQRLAQRLEARALDPTLASRGFDHQTVGAGMCRAWTAGCRPCAAISMRGCRIYPWTCRDAGSSSGSATRTTSSFWPRMTKRLGIALRRQRNNEVVQFWQGAGPIDLVIV